MATNKSTLEALKHISELIDELNAWNRLLKKHNGQQSKQDGLYEKDKYEYDPKKKKIKRISNGKIISVY